MDSDLDPSHFQSPLSTRQLRDRLARRPLHKEGQINQTTKAERTSQNHSPPNSGFATSSPMNNSEGHPGVNGDKEGGGGREGKGKNSRNKRRNNKDLTPGGISLIDHPGKKEKKKTKEDEEEEDEDGSSEESGTEDEDDDEQPSATKVYRSKQDRGTAMTPRTTTQDKNRSLSRRSILKEQLEEESKHHKQFTGFCNGFLAILVVAASIGISAIFLSEPNDGILPEQVPDIKWNETIQELKAEVLSMKRGFPSQDPRTWGMVGASVRSILSEKPNQPAVILLITDGTDEARNTAECLASKISTLVSTLLDKTGTASAHRSFEFQSKSQFFQTIEDSLSSGGSFTLFDLDQLPGDVAMALHAFCDNLNAPYKHSAIAMTMSSSVEPRRDESAEAAAENTLTQAWEDTLDIDRISPLLARVAVSVSWIVKEENIEDVMKRFCPV